MRRKHKTKKIISRKKLKKSKANSKINNSYILHKSDLNNFLVSLLRDFSVVGPKASGSGDYLFSYIHSPDELATKHPVTINTVKEFFFPRQEELFEFKKTENLSKVISLKGPADKPVVFFGLHSCDVRAVNFLDCFFGWDLKDNYYYKRRNNAILISVACNKPPCDGCFCSAVSNGAFLDSQESFDVQLIDLGALFLVECNSLKGQALVKKNKHYFHKSVDTNIEERENLKAKNRKEFKYNNSLSKINKRLSKEDLSNLWEKLGQRCQNCAGCEFICPTCFCFHTQDVIASPEEGKRQRAWDSCTFPSFTKMAGNNNPYSNAGSRIARRFYCKLSNCFKWSGLSGCVGCGRCSYVCPVNLDMESFIVSLSEEKNKQKYKPLLTQP